MKSGYKIFVVLPILLSTTEVVTAQQESLSFLSAVQLPILQANSSAPNQIQEEVERAIKEKEEIHELIESEVNNTFGWTLALLNLLISLLIAIPIITGFTLFLLRRSILDRLVSDIELELRQQLESAKRRMVELQNLLDRREIIIKQLSAIIPTSEEEIVSPTTKQQIKELSKQLESLQAVEPQLLSTASDYIVQGDGFLAGGNYSEALSSYDKAIQMQPSSFEAWLGKGRTLRQLGRYDEALNAYNKTTEIRPDDANVWNGKALALGKLERYQEALDCFDKSIEIDPTYYDPWVNRSFPLDMLGRHDEVEASVNRAIELAPDKPQAYQNLAFHYATLKNSDLAVENFRKAISLDPSSVNKDILSNRFLNPIRDDEKFKQLVREYTHQ
ncbi:MAG: tetratricopeptide repeat protein [Leptolyngbyaceae cyanobacterium SM1_3_5]|nr:tetratricopeptide repeat protein [Leptolyngbyaceae cyanobacterium SM1_3_5]